ncbi:uncharacterized protein LOC108672429 isoform X1 [Hyalella azteca]|uniref:Uncharacterized protein LOC108672429 isoform X1 n=1 Tax=Hyalella azteca TaxID=294128 RepID=A0A8B7NPH3_HYAAZ|nr:uncharacterized protein LOC108672429 isoform X1 [Hyalella azteca]
MDRNDSGEGAESSVAEVSPPLVLTELRESARVTEITRSEGAEVGGEWSVDGTPAAAAGAGVVSSRCSNAPVADLGHHQCGAGNSPVEDHLSSARSHSQSDNDCFNEKHNLGVGIQFVKPLKLEKFSGSVYMTRDQSSKSINEECDSLIEESAKFHKPDILDSEKNDCTSFEERVVSQGLVIERSYAAHTPAKFDLLSAINSLRSLQSDDSMNSSVLSDSVFETSRESEQDMENTMFRPNLSGSYRPSTYGSSTAKESERAINSEWPSYCEVYSHIPRKVDEVSVTSPKVNASRAACSLNDFPAQDDKYESYEFSPSPATNSNESFPVLSACGNHSNFSSNFATLADSNTDELKNSNDASCLKPGRKRFAKAFQRAVLHVPATASLSSSFPTPNKTVKTELIIDPLFASSQADKPASNVTCISEYRIGDAPATSVEARLLSSNKVGSFDASSSDNEVKKPSKHKKHKKSKPRKYFSGILDAIGSAAPIFRNSFSGSSIENDHTYTDSSSNSSDQKKDGVGYSASERKEVLKPDTNKRLPLNKAHNVPSVTLVKRSSSPRLRGSPVNNFANSVGAHDHWRAAYLGHVGCDSSKPYYDNLNHVGCKKFPHQADVSRFTSQPRPCIKKNSDVSSEQRHSVGTTEAMYENVIFLPSSRKKHEVTEEEPETDENDIRSLTNVTTTATITLNASDLLESSLSVPIKECENSAKSTAAIKADLSCREEPKNACDLIYEDWCSAIGDGEAADDDNGSEQGLSFDQKSESDESIQSNSSFYFTAGANTIYDVVKKVRTSFADEFDCPGAEELSGSNSSDEVTYNTTLHESACGKTESGEHREETFGACSSVSSNGSDLMGQFNELHEKYFGKADDRPEAQNKSFVTPNDDVSSSSSDDSQDGIVRAVPCVVLTDSDSADSFRTSAWNATTSCTVLNSCRANQNSSASSHFETSELLSETNRTKEKTGVNSEREGDSVISEDLDKRLSGMWTNGTGADADEESEGDNSELHGFSIRAHVSPSLDKRTFEPPDNISHTFCSVSPSWDSNNCGNSDNTSYQRCFLNVEEHPPQFASPYYQNSAYYVNIGDAIPGNDSAAFDSTSSSPPRVSTSSEPENDFEERFGEKHSSGNDLSASFDSLDSEAGNLTENLCEFINRKVISSSNKLEVPENEDVNWSRPYVDPCSENPNQCSLPDDVIICLNGKWKVSSSSAPSTPCSDVACNATGKTTCASVRSSSHRSSRCGKPPVSPGSRPRDSGGAASRSSSFRRRSRSASAGAKLRGGNNSALRPSSMVGRPRPSSLADMMPGAQTHNNSQESLHSVCLIPSVDDFAPRPQWLAERKKAEGNEAYRNKEYRDALQHYTQAIELCPDCAAYYSNRSACYMMLGRYRDALNDAQHAVALDQHFVKGWIRVGKCHVALGDGVVALSVLRRAQDIEPSNSTVHQEIASAQALLTCVRESQDAATKSDYRTAVFHLDQALRYALGGLELRITKAEYLTFLGRASEAEDIVNDILVSDNNHADALYVRGLCRYYQDNQDAAFQHFQKVLRLVPDHNKAKETYKRAKLLNQKKEEGNAAFKMGDFARAYDIYSEALKIDVLNKNTNSKLYCNRATVAAKLGRLEQAISDCTAALQLDDSYVKAYLRRANTYQQTEQYEEAVRDLEKVYRMQRSQEHKRLLHEAKTQLKRSKRKDYYKILGVSKTASDDEIKKAYRKMALLHHPDRHSSASAAEKAEHERKFKELGEAYAVLTDPKKRGMHDRGQDVNDPDCGGFRDAGFDPNQVFEAFFGSDFFASQSHHYYDQGQAQHQHQQQQPHFQSQFQGPHPGFQGFPGGFQYGF